MASVRAQLGALKRQLAAVTATVPPPPPPPATWEPFPADLTRAEWEWSLWALHQWQNPFPHTVYPKLCKHTYRPAWARSPLPDAAPDWLPALLTRLKVDAPDFPGPDELRVGVMSDAELRVAIEELEAMQATGAVPCESGAG